MVDFLTLELVPERLSKEVFAPFGDVVSCDSATNETMNGNTYSRFLDQAKIDIGEVEASRVQVNLVECNEPEKYPYLLSFMERHPYSSQMFYPLFEHDYLVAVAPPGSKINRSSIRLFSASSSQGVNYRRGTWHMPMLGIAKGDRFLMIERNDMHLNCELFEFRDYLLKIDLPAKISNVLQNNSIGR